MIIFTPSTNFVGNNFQLSSNNLSATSWEIDWSDGTKSLSSSASFNHAFTLPGVKFPVIKEYNNGTLIDSISLSAGVRVNPKPYIELVQGVDPVVGNQVTFIDLSNKIYFANSISAVKVDFGDGSQVAVGTPNSSFNHTYTQNGTFKVLMSAFDVYGNISEDSFNMGVLLNQPNSGSGFEILLCGPEMNSRFGADKKINLTQYLSNYEQENNEEVFSFVKFFEDFLNNLYYGVAGWDTKNENGILSLSYPEQNLSVDHRIGILEKIRRLSELHDPSTIDPEYFQFFAKNLGYNIDIRRDEIGFGFFGTEYGACSATDGRKYFRFMLENLPNWYRIKTTRNMIKIMLYSFGLVGDVINYFTNDYDKNWLLDYNNDMSNIPNDWYPTSHFAVAVDVNESYIVNYFSSLSLADKVIRAVNSVKPINDVFRGLHARTKEMLDVWIAMNSRTRTYIRVPADTYADYWNP